MVKVRYLLVPYGETALLICLYTLEEDPLDRELQSMELARIMASTYPRPLIFLGYVVTKAHAQRREFISPFHPWSLTTTILLSEPI